MASLQETLSKKFGPLPLYGWVGIGGGVLALLYIRGQGSQAGQTAGQDQTAQQQGVSPSPIIVTPSTAALPSPPPSSSIPTSSPTAIGVTRGPKPGYPNIPIVGTTTVTSAGGIAETVQSLPPNSHVTITGAPVQGTWEGIGTAEFYPVQLPNGIGIGYVLAQDFQNISGGGGGGYGGSSVKTIGRVGRFNSPHAHRQVLMLPSGMGGAPNLQPQYGPGWQGPAHPMPPGPGWGGGGHHAIASVSKRTGIPQERLAALNPGLWRPGVIRAQRHMVIG